MSNEKIDYEEALALLKKAVDKRGADFIYPDKWKRLTGDEDDYKNADPIKDGGCVYFLGNGRPACIVGMVLSDIGVKRAEALDIENLSPSTGATDFFDKRFTSDAIHLLDWTQAQQDSGKTWGESVEYAEASYKEYKAGRA